MGVFSLSELKMSQDTNTTMAARNKAWVLAKTVDCDHRFLLRTKIVEILQQIMIFSSQSQTGEELNFLDRQCTVIDRRTQLYTLVY